MANENDQSVVLRDVLESDLPIFFDYQLDKDANYMAAFTAKDPTNRAVFMAHWQRIMADDKTINKTILYNGQVAGSVQSYVDEDFGHREVTYWLGKQYWGKGIATRGLATYLEQITERPLYARVAKDNIGSRRVLEKCGFRITGEDKGFANARSMEIEEYVLTLNADI